ncbi:alpha/beta hydrolase [Oleiagrimonas citrea]|uniref:Alpha/beta fold hydrolase n=1 Tax=Oleiagrimonas citrea TaxID=1665687 RepID=A0A846ZLM5_9GAMM|nr:alpha/beta hydrolase [Oleiagrimonas citrea]NKZ38587.1 alpha/beta fold hydrolase [Oleiagrimonas citrea]
MIERDLDAAGLALKACIHGPADAPPVLALHGWLDNAASFERLAPHLDTHRLIALDLPGHGRSAHLPASPFVAYGIAEYVAAVLAAADALALQQFDLLGHSLGAGVASLVAAAAPDRVRRLGLIEGLGPLADDPARSLQRFRDATARRLRRGTRRLSVFPDVDSAVAARAAATDLPAEQAQGIVERGLIQVGDGYRWSSDPRLTLPTPVRMDEAQIRRLLAGIAAPTLLLLARPQTPYLPDTMMRERAAHVADLRIESLDGHHHLHLEHPETVATLMREHFA